MVIASPHAIERYVERVKPYLGERQAREELEALAVLSPRVARPDWYDERGRSDAFLEIGPDAYAVLGKSLILTVVTKPRDEIARARKNKHNAIKRRAKKDRNRTHGNHGNERPHPEWSAGEAA